MTDVTVHIASGEWCVHFVVTMTQIPIGPWLLFSSSDEIKAKIFAWGHVTTQEIEQYEIDLRRWGIGSVHMLLTEQQLGTLAERKCRAVRKTDNLRNGVGLLHLNRIRERALCT